MLTKIKTATLAGVAGSVVSVETDIRRGLPVFMVVGLADDKRSVPAHQACDNEFRL